jgi:hypothetical protein
VKSVATKSTAPAPVIVNVQPFLPAKAKTTARTRARMPAAAGSTGGKTSFSLRSTATQTVQARKAPVTTAAGSASPREARRARSSRSPAVRSVRKVAPWNAKSSTAASPANTVYGVNRSQKLPAK